MGISQLGIAILPRLLAVEVLLVEPEALQDDVLESCLYILRDRLKGAGGWPRTASYPGPDRTPTTRTEAEFFRMEHER